METHSSWLRLLFIQGFEVVFVLQVGAGSRPSNFDVVWVFFNENQTKIFSKA